MNQLNGNHKLFFFFSVFTMKFRSKYILPFYIYLSTYPGHTVMYDFNNDFKNGLLVAVTT